MKRWWGAALSALVVGVSGCQGSGSQGAVDQGAVDQGAVDQGGADAVTEALADYDPVEFQSELARTGARLLDVRTPTEFAGGHLDGATNIDWMGTSFAADVGAWSRTDAVFLYCQSGTRSAKAKASMQAMGFGELHSLAGGYVAWTTAGLPTVK